MSDSVLAIDADVSISAGAATGHLGGSGSNLVLETTNLTPFFASAGDRSSVNAFADRLARVGVSITVMEGDLPVVEIGAVDHSLLARLVGLRNMRLRRPFLIAKRYVRR